MGKTQAMLRDSIDALVNMDVEQATAVCRRDDEVDRMKHDIRVEVKALSAANPNASAPCSGCWQCPATWSGSPTWPPTSPRTWSTWRKGGSFATATSRSVTNQLGVYVTTHGPAVDFSVKLCHNLGV